MTHFNLTIRGHDLSSKFSIETLPVAIRELGISNVQLALPISFPSLSSGAENLNPGFGTYVKNSFAQSHVQIAILSCYINMIHPDETIKEVELKKFESYLRHAKYFGASIVATETGNVFEEIRYTEQNFTDAAFNKVVKSIQRLVITAEHHQMMIGIEPGRNHPIYSIDKMAELLEQIDSEFIGVILDATNLISVDTYQQQTKIVKEAFERFGDRIVAVHLKDFKLEKGDIVPTCIGEGVMDLWGILDIIHHYKPYINVVMEETKDNAILTAKLLINGKD